VEITAGHDRRIVSDLADFDVTAETALFQGRVVATQEKNILEGGRLSIDRKAGKTRLETPGGGILATFVPPAGTVLRPAKRPSPVETAQASLMGGFKADRSAPMTVEAALLELIDSAGTAVFSGNVGARQGEMLLRTSQLTAFFSGKAGLGLSDTADSAAPTATGKGKTREKTEIVRLEARESVIVTSADDQSATAEWGDFDVKGNRALLGGSNGVVVDKKVKDADDPSKRNLVYGDRLRMDLSTGVYQFESNPEAAAKAQAKGPATSPSPPAASGAAQEDKFRGCAPGRQCGLFYPEQAKKKAIDKLKKKMPEIDALQKKKAPE
jgi:lipopolysaccharide export system protein LptA